MAATRAGECKLLRRREVGLFSRSVIGRRARRRIVSRLVGERGDRGSGCVRRVLAAWGLAESFRVAGLQTRGRISILRVGGGGVEAMELSRDLRLLGITSTPASEALRSLGSVLAGLNGSCRSEVGLRIPRRAYSKSSPIRPPAACKYCHAAT